MQRRRTTATPEISGSVTKARAERSGRRRLDHEDRARVGACARCEHDEGTGADGDGYDVGTCPTNCVERRAFAFALPRARGRRRTRDAAGEVEASRGVDRACLRPRSRGCLSADGRFKDRSAALPMSYTARGPWGESNSLPADQRSVRSRDAITDGPCRHRRGVHGPRERAVFSLKKSRDRTGANGGIRTHHLPDHNRARRPLRDIRHESHD